MSGRYLERIVRLSHLIRQGRNDIVACAEQHGHVSLYGLQVPLREYGSVALYSNSSFIPCISQLYPALDRGAEHRNILPCHGRLGHRSSRQGTLFSSSSQHSATSDNVSTITKSLEGDRLMLTDSAVKKLQELQEKKGNIHLRLQVDGGGCSGFQYVFKIEESPPQDDDYALEVEGVTLLCDSVSMSFLEGATVDYESDLMRSGFVVRV